MFYNYSQTTNQDFTECTSHGACSISPNLSSLQEVMVILLKQTAYYALKLDELGIDCGDIKTRIVDEIATIDAAGEYSEQQTLNMYSRQYMDLSNTKKLYKDTCKKNKTECEELRSSIKFSPQTNISSILQQGEKAFQEKYKKIPDKQKYYSEILFGVIKGVCCNIIVLKDLEQDSAASCNEVMMALNLFNSSRIPIDKIKTKILTLVKNNYTLLELINDTQIKKYGELKEVEVSLSTRPNKAILVSGSSLTDLNTVLEVTKDKNIDVYTNGNLLISHAFSKFAKFENLKGHFGNGVLSSILDFATFPGAILLTKNEAQNVEYLYRGRLYTTDDVPPKGVVKIENNKLLPLIASAEQAKGFTKGQEREPIKVGFNQAELNEKLDNIAKKFNNKVYKHLFIVGFSGNTYTQEDYFKKLFSLVPKNCFIISFSYQAKCDNFLSINIGNDYSLIYSILTNFSQKINMSADNLTFFLTRCDVRSLSNIIGLRDKGVKNIYLSNCLPRYINPSVLKAFRQIFDIHNTSTPKKDMEMIINNKKNNG